MRLSPAQTRVILHCVREQLGADASVKVSIPAPRGTMIPAAET